jgi:hypothetical protein
MDTMSLFLHPQNQELLWSTIHKVAIFPTFVNTISSKEQWFQHMIKEITEKTGVLQANKEQLPSANRLAIQYMVGFIQAHLEKMNTPTPLTSNPLMPSSAAITPNKELSREWISGQKQESLNAVFKERQNIYENVLKSNTAPKSVSFSESAIDEPIQNMDELVKRHMAERDLLAPPPPTPSLNGSPEEKRPTTVHESIRITNEPPIHDLQVSPLQESLKRPISFIETTPSTISLEIVLSAIQNLSEKMDVIFKEIETLKSRPITDISNSLGTTVSQL